MIDFDIRRRSPLADCAPIEAGDGSYRVEERPFLAKFIMRAASADAKRAVKSALQADLPEPTKATETADNAVLWLGPDEYLITGAPSTDVALEEALQKALGECHHQIADVGDYYTTISVSGSFARDALARVSTLDLHPRAFNVGSVAGTTFAKGQAVMHLREGPRGETFDLYVRWSMAAYLWALMLEAARVKGVQAPPKMAVTWSINPE